MPYVVVFDTNVLFSSLGWRGRPYQCVSLARQDAAIQSVTCYEILNELEQKLRFKMSMTTEEAQRSIVEICAFSKLSTLSGLKGVVADPKDDMVIDCAVTGGATHIVSGDKKHLLPIGEYQGIKIVSPAEFLGMVGQGD